MATSTATSGYKQTSSDLQTEHNSIQASIAELYNASEDNRKANTRALEKIDDATTKINQANSNVNILVVVLFIGFTAMFGTIASLIFTYFDNDRATSQVLNQQVQELNDKLDSLNSK